MKENQGAETRNLSFGGQDWKERLGRRLEEYDRGRDCQAEGTIFMSSYVAVTGTIYVKL